MLTSDEHEVVESRTITERTRQTISMDIADAETAAKFLEWVAAQIRARGRLKITVE